MTWRTPVIVCGVLCISGLAAVLAQASRSSGFYTVTQVQLGLHQQPAAWSGRTVLVRGWIEGYAMSGCLPLRLAACGNYSAIFLASNFGQGQWQPTELTISLRRGATWEYVRRLTASPPIEAVLSWLHCLGPLGRTIFPWSGSSMLRIRLGPSSPCMWANTGTANCSVGLLLRP